jgi:hypothetical protein
MKGLIGSHFSARRPGVELVIRSPLLILKQFNVVFIGGDDSIIYLEFWLDPYVAFRFSDKTNSHRVWFGRCWKYGRLLGATAPRIVVRFVSVGTYLLALRRLGLLPWKKTSNE